MNSLFTIIKYDYLQRTRSYAFLITLCISLAIAYTFIPEPNANYSTIRISNYIGYNNSAWIGYVTAMMSSIFLSLIGFYLVNSGIKSDIETKVGQIISSTKINNFSYLISKALSNFLILLTIVCVIFIMSILLFFLYNEGFPFELFQFIKPYVLITIPTMFFVASLAVFFEVILPNYSILQNVVFFILFSFLMVFTHKKGTKFPFDVFGNKIVINQLEKSVKKISNTTDNLTVGYLLGNIKSSNKFHFNGIKFPISFIISRFLLILLSIGIIVFITPFFHRFNIRKRITQKKITKPIDQKTSFNELILSKLPEVQINYGILPIIKTELILLIRKNKRWLWFVNIIGMGLLLILPLKAAHEFILPILWFLQVNRISELATKETSNRVHHFAFTSYKPLFRLLASQLFAGILLMLFLASPLITRLIITLNITAALPVVFGSIFIVLLASSLGMLTKGKKLFEVLFFLITYANINGIPFVDYFGGLSHTWSYLLKLTLIVIILGGISFLTRINQLKKV